MNTAYVAYPRSKRSPTFWVRTSALVVQPSLYFRAWESRSIEAVTMRSLLASTCLNNLPKQLKRRMPRCCFKSRGSRVLDFGKNCTRLTNQAAGMVATKKVKKEKD